MKSIALLKSIGRYRKYIVKQRGFSINSHSFFPFIKYFQFLIFFDPEHKNNWQKIVDGPTGLRVYEKLDWT